MTTSADEPSFATALAALSEQAGDVHVSVTQDLICLWTSDGSVRPGVTVAEAFAAEDAATVASVLSRGPAGPVWARLRTADDGPRWVSVISVPQSEGGWVLQLRESRQLDPTAGTPGASLDVAAGTTDREHVLNEVAWLLSATPRTGKEIAVASCDLDDFEFVNEDYGREAGDEILRIVTGRISDALRSGDLVARLEDDQLLVVLRGVHHLRGAIRVANKIRTAVEDPIVMPFGEIVQTVSVGVTLISRGESVDSVLERAEGAMAMAKEAGRNTVMSSPPI
jgi:diguanylate cyclase (GGDEF)-like protein